MPAIAAPVSCASRKPSCTTSLREGSSFPATNFGYRSDTTSAGHSAATLVGLNLSSDETTDAISACRGGAKTSSTRTLWMSCPGFDRCTVPTIITCTAAVSSMARVRPDACRVSSPAGRVRHLALART